MKTSHVGKAATPCRWCAPASMAGVAAVAIAAVAVVTWTAGAVAPIRAIGIRTSAGLQQDVDAIHAVGSTSVLAQVQAAHGTRADSADVNTGDPVPWTPATASAGCTTPSWPVPQPTRRDALQG